MRSMSIDTQDSWSNDVVASVYARSTSIMPAEVALFARAWSHVEGGRVLDLGVGGGRTLPYLRGPAKKYVAVDYSEAMVRACRAKHPGADVRFGDARRLDGLDDGAFDFVFFSYNSIDCVPLEGRRQVLEQVRRVLRPGGKFGFSSHNARLVESVPAKLHLPEVEWTKNPPKLAARLARAGVDTLRMWKNQRRLRDGESRGEGWVVVNDGAHLASMLFVYADPRWQLEELERFGFTGVEVIDERGRVVAPDQAMDPWIHYLCDRP
jgi:SAM-dependent methyltransferase